MIDLFLSKREKLLQFIKEKHYIRTSEIIAWGVRNFSNRADRDARLLAEEGEIKRLSDSEKMFRFGGTKEGIYEFVGEKGEESAI